MNKDFKPRKYQETLFESSIPQNTLVVLPTGLGKTAIAAMMMNHRLKTYKNSKCLLLAPTKPLVEQHESSFKEFLPHKKVISMTGSISPDKRKQLWLEHDVIISTPQGLENDLIRRNIDFKDVSLLVFDEAHRATGDYSYVFIASKYVEQTNHERILALTASPGNTKEKILEVCKNLYVEDVQYKSYEDEEVQPYVQDYKQNYVKVKLDDDLKRVLMFLNRCHDSKLLQTTHLGVPRQALDYNKTQLLKLMSQLHGKIAKGEKDFEILKSISLLAEVLKIQHAIELAESQGIHSLIEYLENLREEAKKSKVKAVKNLVADINFRSAYVLAKNLYEKGITHPKLPKLKELVKESLKENKEGKIIIFTQYRDTASKIQEVLKEIKVTSKLFFGQAKKKNVGLSQKQQKKVIEEFSQKKFSCLIATSVGEEGLDIPEVDLVMFYEPVPSAVRTVQRRGRTGRQKEGKMIMLITENSRDEAYRWSAHHKEKKMYDHLKFIQKHLVPQKKEKKLQDYEEKIRIKADYREKGSALLKELLKDDVEIDLETLAVGDFVLSEEVVVEFKNVSDFVDSILDNRLLSQARDLKQYKKPFILLEGEEDLYSQRRIHPNAIRGMIAALTINYGIPIIRTKNPKDSANFLKVIARREQVKDSKEYQLHTAKPLTDKELQEYIVSSFPGIGSTLSKPLLEHFESIKKIVNATEKELQEVDLIGDKKAKRLKDIFTEKYSHKRDHKNQK